MRSEKPLDGGPCGHEVFGEHWKRCLADDDQQPKSGAQDGTAFVGAPADAAVMGDRDPATIGDTRYPLFVGDQMVKMVVVKLYLETGCTQDTGKLLPEVPVREEDRRLLRATRRARKPRPRSPLPR